MEKTQSGGTAAAQTVQTVQTTAIKIQEDNNRPQRTSNELKI